MGGELRMQVIRTGRKAFNHTVQKPRQTDAHGTADPAKRETLAQQLCDPLTLRGRNTPVRGVSRELATARFTLVILLPMASMAIFLAPMRSTRGAGIFDDPGYR